MYPVKNSIIALLVTLTSIQIQAQFVSAGNGSYTQKFPGTDAAGRNGFPSGKPLTIGNAAQKMPPTNDWWSAKIKNAHCDNLFNYPFTLKTVNAGLVTTYIPWGVIDDIQPIIMGVNQLNSSTAWISDFSDWTIQMTWKNGSREFKASTGVGMPFLYFEKDSLSQAQITVNSGTVTIDKNQVLIENARNGADFIVYAPTGSTWTQNGNVLSSELNGKNYWSMAMLPHETSNLAQAAETYKKYAYVFPKNTHSDFKYDSKHSIVTTNFRVEVDVKEGLDTIVLLGLLPHQWAHLSTNPTYFSGEIYRTVRGDLRMWNANSFQTKHVFRGILPTLPYLNPYSDGFNALDLKQKIESIQSDGLAEWTDSYNEGQVMNRLIQTARIAHEMQLDESVKIITKTVKSRLENWLKAEAGEVAFLFYYDSTWKSLLGYPAGHGQDNNLNDHHFHWGYFIHAAAFLEEFEPGWAAKWGPMINLLIRDAASTDRNDKMFPHLRNFNPYQGHCWANGFASFPQGNDQESTSESMQFNSSLIHWGSITQDTAIRDLGIYLYATEQAAVEEYWFDKQQRNFKANQPYELVSRVWGNSYDNGTFWTADIAASYGIELYPIHGGSLYLAHDTNYVRRLWNGMAKNTGILSNQANDNLWHDVYWTYLAFIDAPKALQLYQSYPNRNLKFGISDAQTYHFLHSLNALGTLDTSVKSNHPLAVVFTKKDQKTYIAKNYGNDTLTVVFSDDYQLQVPPHKLSTSRDLPLKATLFSDFQQAYYGASVNLSVDIIEGSPERVVYFLGNDSFAEQTTPPFQLKSPPLAAGWNDLSARVYIGNQFVISNFVRIRVGKTQAFAGTIPQIPGTIQSGNFDEFEAGVGQGLTYYDLSQQNFGNYRKNEYVDASDVGTEGKVITWIEASEWVDYTLDVQESGTYEVHLRYASNNASSGPLHMEINGEIRSEDVFFSSTGSWDKWSTKIVSGVSLRKGVQTLRLRFKGAGFNLGTLSFFRKSDLNRSLPKAHAGANVWINPSTQERSLDGTQSEGTEQLRYRWSQIYGPSILQFNDTDQAICRFSGFDTGVYLCQLTVIDGVHSDADEVFIVVSENPNTPPSIAIVSPSNGAQIWENEALTIKTSVFDLIGEVVQVKLFINEELVDSLNAAPFEFRRTFPAGIYELKAQAQDDSGVVSMSQAVVVNVDSLPSCRFPSSNGDFEVVFSNDKSNPTINFIPKKSGTGSPTCILYYGANPSNMPGYIVKPNVPFRINAAAGSQVHYYYTYSFNGMEKNTADKKGIFSVGLCKPEVLMSLKATSDETFKYYPNPSSTSFICESTLQGKIQIYKFSGEAVSPSIPVESKQEIQVGDLSSGYYLIRWENALGRKYYPLIIQK